MENLAMWYARCYIQFGFLFWQTEVSSQVQFLQPGG